MRFRVPLLFATGLLAACNNGPAAPSPETTPSIAPGTLPTTVVQKGEPAEPRSSQVAIAEQQSLAPRNIADDRLMPLADILDIARRRVPGDVIDVELDDDDDNSPEYELEILTSDGRSVDVKIDARSGRIIEVEED